MSVLTATLSSWWLWSVSRVAARESASSRMRKASLVFPASRVMIRNAWLMSVLMWPTLPDPRTWVLSLKSIAGFRVSLAKRSLAASAVAVCLACERGEGCVEVRAAPGLFQSRTERGPASFRQLPPGVGPDDVDFQPTASEAGPQVIAGALRSPQRGVGGNLVLDGADDP